MTMMTAENKRESIEKYFDKILAKVGCELKYRKDYELLIAVMLSAQTTDNAVNNVTKILFKKYNTLEKLSKANVEDIEEIIKPIGLYKNKANNINQICNSLLSNFNGELPSNKNDLVTFAGVGNKTASVVRAEIFKIPEFPVDTHVARISKRLCLANEEDSPIEIERKLKKYFEKENWIKLHHQFIHFGRRICTAINPKCEKCKLKEFCNYNLNSNNESKASK